MAAAGAGHCWTFAEHSPWYFQRGVETHRENCDEQICEGEGDEEVVVDVSEFPVEDDADDDEAVVDDCEEDDAEQNNAFHHQQEDIWQSNSDCTSALLVGNEGYPSLGGMKKANFWFVQNWRKIANPTTKKCSKSSKNY